MRFLRCIVLAVLLVTLVGCFSVPISSKYKGPDTRPPELDQYYNATSFYAPWQEEVLNSTKKYDTKRLKLESSYGPITIDYYQRHQKSENLIFVFPLLGGKNIIVDHFAEYFANHGFDAAIVHRNDDFKNPDRYFELEEILRQGVVRDRIAIDFFEKEQGKKTFGTFGISRGAINVAITAGVDPRLKYNVLAMGASDLAELMMSSNQRRLQMYRQTVMDKNGMTSGQFHDHLKEAIKTDPKYLARYMDARNALMFLCLLDKTVPIRYGNKLRKKMGNPKTIYLLADHYTSIAFTEYLELIPAGEYSSLFPFGYIESESLEFYRKSFGQTKTNPWLVIPKLLQAPFNLIGQAIMNP